MSETTPKRKSLYNITTEFSELMNQIELADGEITEETENALKINSGELQVKAANYVEFIGQTKAFIGRIDNEVKRLQQMKKTNANIVNRLEAILKFSVEQFGEFTINEGMQTVKLRKTSSVVISDPKLVPKKFKTTKLEVTINKSEIKKALTAGEKVKGAHIQEGGNLLISGGRP